MFRFGFVFYFDFRERGGGREKQVREKHCVPYVPGRGIGALPGVVHVQTGGCTHRNRGSHTYIMCPDRESYNLLVNRWCSSHLSYTDQGCFCFIFVIVVFFLNYLTVS